jgi:hypothetical protein
MIKDSPDRSNLFRHSLHRPRIKLPVVFVGCLLGVGFWVGLWWWLR